MYYVEAVDEAPAETRARRGGKEDGMKLQQWKDESSIRIIESPTKVCGRRLMTDRMVRGFESESLWWSCLRKKLRLSVSTALKMPEPGGAALL